MDADLDPAAPGHDADCGSGRCPDCGARCAPASLWCSLCFADLRPPVPSEPAVPAGRLAADDLALRSEVAGPAPRIPLLSDLLTGPGGAIAVMLVGTTLVGSAAVALMWLLGSLL